MFRMRRLLALLLFAPALLAQDEDLPPDEVADLVDRYLERAEESLREGAYDEARLRFKKALKRDPKNANAQLGIARAYIYTGRYDKADKEIGKLLDRDAGNRAAKVLRARIALQRGRTQAVRDLAKDVLAKGGEGPDLIGLEARYLLARALAHDGRGDDARDALDPVRKYYERRAEFLADAAFNADTLKNDIAKARPISREMTILASALRLYVKLSPLDHDDLQVAYDLIGFAKALDRENWDAWIEEVRVTRLERAKALSKARKVRDIVTKRNPELAELYVEVARSLMTGFSQGEAKKAAVAALTVNPSSTGARALLAQIQLEDNEYAGAEDHIEKGLAVNPRHRDLLALKATLQLLLGDEEGFEAGMQEMLKVDETYGEGFHIAGLVVAARQRRYDKAVKLVRRGLRLQPANFQAHATLGIFLANLGRAEEAIDALKQSHKLHPFDHPIRENFHAVLKYVTQSMTEMKTEHFVIRFDPGEYPVMSLFLPRLLEECWDDMVKRYGFTPKAPILIEVFRNKDDFSVRTLGLPGIPALGACFGGLITLDSPLALPPGSFLWASTARHEFAHVMSLQLSGGQVPRWFTEGLSVLEEKPLDTGWGREEQFERQLFDGWATGTLPKIGTFDAMFRGPRVAYAYYVGGLMLEFLEQRSGEEGIVDALRLYGKDRPMTEVFQKAFGLRLDEFDKLFAEHVGKRVSAYRIQPNYSLVLTKLRGQALKNPGSGEVLVKLAWAYFQQGKFVDAGAFLDRARRVLKPDHQLLLLLDANMQLRAGRIPRATALFERFFAVGGEDFDARMVVAGLYAQKDPQRMEAELKKAKAAWPLRVQGRNPYSLLRRLYLTQSREADALKELEQQAAIASKNIGMRLTLAREYARADRDKDAIRVLEEAMGITVYDPRVLAGLMVLYRDVKNYAESIRIGRARVALRGDDQDDTVVGHRWLDLAEVYLMAGNVEEARTAFEQAAKRVDAEDERLKSVKKQLEAARK
jgi:tetratricopeptide (TPR) repeat protein